MVLQKSYRIFPVFLGQSVSGILKTLFNSRTINERSYARTMEYRTNSGSTLLPEREGHQVLPPLNYTLVHLLSQLKLTFSEINNFTCCRGYRYHWYSKCGKIMRNVKGIYLQKRFSLSIADKIK